MGVMEHFPLLVPGPLPGCIFMRHIIFALFYSAAMFMCVCVFSGLHLSKWKNHLPYVVDTINRNKPVFKSKLNMLIQYFTRPPVIVPQNQNNHYKYNIGDRVRLPLTKAQRNAIGFKWSLHRGEVPL